MSLDARYIVKRRVYTTWSGLLLLAVLGSSSVIPPRDTELERNERQAEKTPFTFDDLYSGQFNPKGYSIRWLSENKYTYTTADGDLGIYDLDTNSTQVLVTAAVLTEFGTSTYYLSADLRYLLLEYDRQKVWRYSYTATYRIHDREATEPDKLGMHTVRFVDFPKIGNSTGLRLQYAGWSPTGHKLICVMENDLYYQADPQTEARRVTSDGAFESRFNGVTDWLYEEDVLGRRTTIYWTPDSQRFLWASLDASSVPKYQFPHYGPEEDMYGTMETVAYPKAGVLEPGTNTKVNLYVTNTDDTSSRVELRVPDALASQDHYYTQASWASPTLVYVVWANRVQNRTIGVFCEVLVGVCQLNYERQQTGGWISPVQPIWWINDGAAFVTILPRDEGATGSWKQVAVMATPVTEEGYVTFVTQGQAEVTSIRAVDQARRIIYYTSTNGDPTTLQLFRVGLAGSSVPSTPECLTCDLGPDCLYNTATFSRAAQYYMRMCLGPGLPSYVMKATDFEMNVVLEDNAEVRTRLDTKLLPSLRFMQVPVGAGYQAWARLWLPPNFDENQKYPLIVNTYAGPGSQGVTKRYSIGWQTYLTSSENVIYANIDGRGTRGRGDDFMHLLYRKIGTIEVEDQVLAGKYFRENLAYVNGSAMAIWGWSYGGYATLHAVASDLGIYNCGISVAALIDRRFYDTAHSERYMGMATPEDNQAGYQAGKVLAKTERFRDKKLLIAHGIADDNVHCVTTGQLVKALTDAGIQFKLQLYPDKDHSIRGGNTRCHLYRKFSNFLLTKCWGRTPNS